MAIGSKYTTLDHEDIALCHKYRLSLTSAPRQSSFRVVAVIFYELLGVEEEHKRHHVVGANDEPCYINGSICAERAALVQLRFLPLKKISKVVITTDACNPIFPGMLCREFMSSHPYIDPHNMPIITAGSVCQNEACKLNIGTKASSSYMDKLENGCTSIKTNTGKYVHHWEVIKTTLPALYPHPSPYTRLSASESIQVGKSFSNSVRLFTVGDKSNLSEDEQKLVLETTKAAQNGDDRGELHPIQYAAAVLFEDGSIETSCQRKSLEYGCSIDAVTQLLTSIEKKQKEKQTTKPKILVQTDQFGIIHTPFATARAFLSEFDDFNMEILVQDLSDPPDHADIGKFDVNDIAPSAPDMGDLWTE